MNMSPSVLVAALAVSVWSAGSAEAAVMPAHDLLGPGPAPLVRADISARDCVQGGGVIIITADGEGANSFTMRCQGGIHDGETIS